MPASRDGPKLVSSSPWQPLAIGARRPDAIVIGSGFGGEVSAARLAERGLDVLLLERGPWWGDTPAAPHSPRRSYPHGLWGLRNSVRDVRWAAGKRSRCLLLNRGGLLEIHRFQRLTAVTASGVGGGSLIYADVQAHPDDRFFDYFPAEITAQEMRPYYQRVRETLQPSPLPDQPARTVTFKRAVAACGLASAGPADLAVDWPPTNAAELARRSSTYLLGCRYPAKRSLDKTYVAQAIGYGAEVRSLSEVTALERNAAAYRVYWIDHAVRRRYWADAPIVVVAAGTLGTLRLLFAARDRDRSLQLPPALGRRFSVGGDTMIVVDNSPDAGESSYGPCPGATVPVARDGQHRFLITEMGVPADALSLPKPVRRRLQRSLVLAGMGRDASTGVVEFDGRELRTGTDRSLDPELFAELESTMTQIAQAYRPRRILPSVRPHSGQLVTVHPFGGAAIGDGPEQGVVDHMGQVFGNPGLYVADASLFPHAPGLPPAMTIAALAERQAALIGRPVVRERSTSPAPYRAHSPTAGQCADATHRASQQEGHAAGGITSRPPASGALGSGARGGTMLAERIYRQTNRLYDRARSPAAIDAARVEPIGGMDQLGGHRYCVLISYRRDGTPVASPLWFGLQEGRLYVRTGAATAKLQRIRRHPQVRVASSTMRGVLLGPPFVGQARILDQSEEPNAERAIRANYRWLRRIYLRLLMDHVAARYVEIIPVDASGADSPVDT